MGQPYAPGSEKGGPVGHRLAHTGKLAREECVLLSAGTLSMKSVYTQESWFNMLKALFRVTVRVRVRRKAGSTYL